MIKYVCGFMFTYDYRRLLLLRKSKPDWQKGLLNAPGGKVEDNESNFEAVVREIFEETGIVTYAANWEIKLQLIGKDYLLDIFKTVVTEQKHVTKDSLVEPYDWYNIDTFGMWDIIPNLKWIIPYLLHADNNFASVSIKR